MHDRRILVALAIAIGLAIPITFLSGSAANPPKLVVEHFMVDAVDPGIKLYVRNKRPENLKKFTSGKTLLFVHGATQPAEATFDLTLEDVSWMDYIARHGWDVYLVDVRGYGGSTRPPEMSKPAGDNPPVATTDVAVRDVGTAVDFILRRRELSKLNLMGWSWGTVIMGAYSAKHPDKVERLVLYAPVWVKSLPASQAARRPLGAYVETSMAITRERIQAGAPEDRKNDLMPASWFEAWSAATLGTDPLGSKQQPPVLRTPAGVAQDNRDFWDAGKPFYDPAGIKAPTLLIAAEWDYRVPDAQAIFPLLRNPNKQLVLIGEGTHVAMLEKSRMNLFRAVQFFLDHPMSMTQ